MILVGLGTLYGAGPEGRRWMRRLVWLLTLVVMILILGGGKVKAQSSQYGFLYNGTTYTTIALPGAINSDVTGISGGNVIGDYVTYKSAVPEPSGCVLLVIGFLTTTGYAVRRRRRPSVTSGRMHDPDSDARLVCSERNG